MTTNENLTYVCFSDQQKTASQMGTNANLDHSWMTEKQIFTDTWQGPPKLCSWNEPGGSSYFSAEGHKTVLSHVQVQVTTADLR